MTGPATLCDALVWRCVMCDNAVAPSRVRIGEHCPHHPEAEVVEGACRNLAALGRTRCRRHGAAAPASKAKAAERAESETVRRLLAKLGDPTPIGNPYARLLEVAAEASQWLEVTRTRVNELDTLADRDTLDVERARALVTLYVDAQRQLATMLRDIAKLDLERLALAFEQRIADADMAKVVRALDAATGLLPFELVAAVRQAFGQQLRAVANGTPAPPLPEVGRWQKVPERLALMAGAPEQPETEGPDTKHGFVSDAEEPESLDRTEASAEPVDAPSRSVSDPSIQPPAHVRAPRMGEQRAYPPLGSSGGLW